MSIGERIKKRRKELGFNADKLAELIGKNRATIYRYESNDIENMPYDVMEPLSKALQVSPAYLMGWVEELPSVVRENKYPYISQGISAGCPESIEAVTREESIILPDSVMGKYSGSTDIQMMRVNGESMNKVIPNGSLIAVKKTSLENLKNGDVVVYSDDHEYSVKRFYNLGDRLVFRPDSNDESFTERSTQADETVDIIGKVVVYIVELS